MDNAQVKGYIFSFLTVLVWGVTFISTKILLRDFTPFEILATRFFIGWLTLWALAPGLLKVHNKKDELLFAAAGISGVTLYFLFENQALTYTLASNVSIIVTAAPFFTAILACFWLRAEKPGLNYYIGFFIAICGIIIISLNGKSFQLNPLGDILALLAAVAWAFYSIFTAKLTNAGYGSLKTTRRIFFYGLLFMLPVSIFMPLDLNMTKLLKPVNMANLLFLGVGASAICFATWTFSIKCIGASKASAFIYLVPVVTIIAAAIILAEPVTLLSAIGAILTIGGLIISEMGIFNRKKH